MSNPTVKDFIREGLERHGYDGLFCDECGCALDDLMPCGGDWAIHCTPGYKVNGCTCGEGCDFHISKMKEQETKR